MAGICEEHRWPDDESAKGCLLCRIEVCDVCRATPAWTYLSQPTTTIMWYRDRDTGQMIRYTQENSPDWAICQACHLLIQANDLNALADRALDEPDIEKEPVVRDPQRRAALKVDIMDLHRQFIAGIRQPPTPVLPA